MEEWKEYRLGDFMEFNPRISLKKDTVARKITMDQLVPHSRDIYSWTYEPYSGGAKFQNGDTIMARITPCLENGKHAFISLLDENEIAYGSTEYIVIRGRKGISDNLFVYYLTHFPSFKDAAIKSMVGTSGRQRAQVDVLENMTMKLPSIAEQKSIADILTKLDDKIAVNKQINDNLEQQAQALFKSWFVDFEPFRDQPFVESELGTIPEGWRVVSLGDLMSYNGGSQPPASEFVEDYKDGYVRFIQIRDYASDGHITYIPISKRNKLCDIRDIMIARYGASLGRICYGLRGAYNVALAKVTPIEPYYLEFLRCYLNTREFYEGINNKGNRAVQAGFNQSDIQSFRIAFPNNEDIIQKFENVCSAYFDNRLLLEQESRRLATLRDTLLPRLMSGELKVEDVTL